MGVDSSSSKKLYKARRGVKSSNDPVRCCGLPFSQFNGPVQWAHAAACALALYPSRSAATDCLAPGTPVYSILSRLPRLHGKQRA